MLVAVPEFRIRPEERERYTKAANALVAASVKEPGVISYGVHQAISDPNLFVHVEVYRDQAAFDEHVASTHVQAFLVDLDVCRYPDPDIHVYHVSKVEQIHID